MATAGLTKGLTNAAGLNLDPDTKTFLNHVQYNAIQSTVNKGLQLIGGKKIEEEEALKDGVLHFTGNTLGSYGAQKIGRSYQGEEISYGEHKALHGVIGGLTGGILNASKSSKEIKQGVISGATGAMAAEIFIEAKTQDLLAQTSQEILQKGFKDQGGLLDRKAFMEEFQNALQKETLWAQVVGSSAGALVGKDANTAYWASSNAVENNFLPTALQVGLLFYTAHDIYQTYQEHGALAALQKVQDEALLVATGYGCWKVAGKIYVTAETALKAYLSHSPALASAIGKISGATSKLLEGVKERVGIAPSKIEVTSQLEMKGVSKAEVKPHVHQIKPQGKQLIPGEGTTGKFKELQKQKRTGDNLADHHIPNDLYMNSKGVRRADGIAMKVEYPNPGSGGRHREIHKKLIKQDPSLEPRNALAQGVQRVREVYKKDQVYTSEVRSGLQKVIELNKQEYPHLFVKK